MRPLNYAILKHLESVPFASPTDVIEALKGEYGSFKALRFEGVRESLMTAEQNGLLEEDHYDLDDQENLHIYYRVTDYGRSMIDKYIK
ncbi:MAG: hypothetical protein IJ131_07145 [Eggerthellaceae bacterium]|nr:hypothetical protein [Eggerthellaceae bacterium]